MGNYTLTMTIQITIEIKMWQKQ